MVLATPLGSRDGDAVDGADYATDAVWRLSRPSR
jgi:hypothetical protein